MNDNTKKEFSREQRLAILNAIRAAVKACAHHQHYTKRVQDKIREAIDAVLGGCTIYCGDDSISIWHSGLCHYDSRPYLIWNWPSRYSPPKPDYHWSQPILRECDRCDDSDVAEREALEAKCDVEFSKAELRIRELEKRIEQIRGDAKELIEAMPVPSCATIRKDSPYWTSPTRKTAAQYPNLFGKDGVL